MTKQAKQKEKRTFFSFYQNSILVICAVSVLLFAVWWVLNSFPSVFTEDWMVQLKDCSYSLFHLLTSLMLIFCAVHVMALLLRMFFSKHSFIWLIGQQIIPLAFPLIVVILINLLSGHFDDRLSDVIVGVISGVISSIIVLLLDRNHLLVRTIIQHTAWEYAETGEAETQLKSPSASVPHKIHSNKSKRGKKHR